MDEVMELRPTKCDLGVLSRADGSALLTQGDTVLLAAVYGPCEVKPQRLMIDRSHIEVIYKTKSGQPSVTDKLKESTLTSVCQKMILASQHPRTSITVIVQEMQDSGGLLACAINAACLALIDSGVPLKFLVAAVSCMLTHTNEIVLEPDPRLLKDSKARFTLVFDGVRNDVVATETLGHFDSDQFQQVISKCRVASRQVLQLYRTVVSKHADSISLS